MRPKEQVKIQFTGKHIEPINVDVVFEGPERDVLKITLRVSSK